MTPIKISASLGQLSGNKDYQGAYTSFINQGGTSFRVMGLFNKSFDKDINKICDHLLWLTLPNNQKRARLLICIDCLPYSWLGDYTASELSLAYPQDALTYCNRFMLKPTRYQEYYDLLQGLVEGLKVRNILHLSSFELANEPNARRYGWMTFADCVALNQLKYSALVSSLCKIYVAGYNSGLMQLGDVDFTNYIYTSELFAKPMVGFSSHYYDLNNHGKWDFESNHYPTRPFNDSVVSEWNMYGGFDKSGAREKDFNSVNYLRCWIKYLAWASDKNISEIFVHPLAAIAKDEHSKMALWFKKWSIIGGSYYTYAPAKTMLYDLIRVISGGYTVVDEDTVQGVRERLMIIGDKYITEPI